MALAMRGYSVLSLFLVTNLLCCCGAFPIAFALVRRANRFFTETGFVVGLASGILAVSSGGSGSGGALWVVNLCVWGGGGGMRARE